MKNLDKFADLISTAKAFGYYNFIQRFGLKEESNRFCKVYRGICTEDSEYQFLIGTMRSSGGITYIVEDNKTGEYLNMFALRAEGESELTAMFKDWTRLSYKYDKFNIYNYETKKMEVVPNIDMSEDEHFQFMLLHDIPDYDTVQSVLKYHKEVSPMLKEHKLFNIITYTMPDFDFTKMKIKPEVIDTCMDLIPESSLYKHKDI